MMSYRPLALAATVAALLSMYVTGAEAQPAYVAPGSVYIGAGAGPVYMTPSAPAAAYVGRRGHGNGFEEPDFSYGYGPAPRSRYGPAPGYGYGPSPRNGYAYEPAPRHGYEPAPRYGYGPMPRYGYRYEPVPRRGRSPRTPAHPPNEEPAALPPHLPAPSAGRR